MIIKASQTKVCGTFIFSNYLASICVQNKWGTQKIQLLDAFTATLLKIDPNNAQMIRAYGKIDAYSQGKLNNFPLPSNMSARNMGKNDLWIAAATQVIQATLLTTDKDFFTFRQNFF